jgi:hypothetical protein
MTKKWRSVSNLKWGHIFNKMQILILSYKEPNEVNEIGRQLCQVEKIATMCVIEHEKKLKTQSEYWCPMIMEALKLSGYSIPNLWTNIEKDPIIQKYAEELSKINGWSKYAYHLLDTYETKLKTIPNNFNDQMYDLADEWVVKLKI